MTELNRTGYKITVVRSLSVGSNGELRFSANVEFSRKDEKLSSSYFYGNTPEELEDIINTYKTSIETLKENNREYLDKIGKTEEILAES